jgi:hypothetical protein
VQSDPPPGIDIATAMDEVILDIARAYNQGELRVPDFSRVGQKQLDGNMDMAPLYFAPGANANPLVDSSNPLDIARWISIGLYDSSTLYRIQRFARALLRARRISQRIANEIVANSTPSRQPVFVYTNTGRVNTWYRGLDDKEQFADEFITYPEESVRNYARLIEDRVSIIGGQAEHTQRFNP